MFGVIQKSAETWFVAGTTSLLAQRMHGFKELSAYLPADERDIADHEAWIRFGEPYSGARRKAGYVDAADFLLKAYAVIANRLIEREGWPEPASQPAKLVILAVLAAFAEDGEDAATYDIKTAQAERAEHARLKQVQEQVRVAPVGASGGRTAGEQIAIIAAFVFLGLLCFSSVIDVSERQQRGTAEATISNATAAVTNQSAQAPPVIEPGATPITAAAEEREKLSRTQKAREAAERDRQAKENERLLRLQASREAMEKDLRSLYPRLSQVPQAPPTPTGRPVDLTPGAASRGAVRQTCDVTHQTMDGVEVSPIDGLKVIIQQNETAIIATLADLSSVAPILGSYGGTVTAGWRLREKGEGVYITVGDDAFTWLIERAGKELIVMGRCLKS